MALFIDGPPSGVEDMTRLDSSLLDVCRVEQIDATAKLQLAQEELAIELAAIFEDQRFYTSLRGCSSLHIGQVEVTPSLKSWHTRHAVGLVYRDAYFNQLNDRFRAKWIEYQNLAREAKESFRQIGVGIVLDPLRRPAGPNFALIPATESAGTWYVSITILNGAGEESAGSLPLPIVVPEGNAVTFTPGASGAKSAAWNVYAGTTPTELSLQTASPLNPADSWTLYPSQVVVCERSLGKGQNPNLHRSLPRLLQRG